jgi:hypothetical protein
MEKSSVNPIIIDLMFGIEGTPKRKQKSDFGENQVV